MIDWFILGAATGMRCMTPIAVVCWFAWLGLLPVQGTWASWSGHLVTVIVFTLCAVGEWIGDTRPSAPNRTAPVPALARIVLGTLSAAILSAAALEPLAGAIVFGLAGALTGTWGGFYLRRFLSGKLRRDLPVALSGSALALALSIGALLVCTHSLREHPPVYSPSVFPLHS